MNGEEAVLPRASLLGQKVEVRSVVELQRRNTTVVFKQQLFHEDRLVAKAEVTCVCIKYVPRAYRGPRGGPVVHSTNRKAIVLDALTAVGRLADDCLVCRSNREESKRVCACPDALMAKIGGQATTE
jgi:hypothetical protein